MPTAFDAPDTPDETLPRPPKRQPGTNWRVLALLGAAGGTVLVALLGLTAALLLQTIPVTIIVSADALQIDTRAGTVGELLDERGIALAEGDLLSPPVDTPLSPGMVVRIEKARGVTLSVDGETRTLWTALTNPAEILASAGVQASADDRLLIDGTPARVQDLRTWPVPVMSIALRRALTVTIDDAGIEQTLVTTGDTVGEALYEAGITLYLADAVTPELNAPVLPGATIQIYRSRPISIIADGQTLQTRTRGEVVADVLAEAGVALVGLDYAIPDEDTPLRPGMHIRVIRVREALVTEEAPLPFATVYQADPDLELDSERVVQAGAEGLEARRIRVRYENDFEVERTPEETTVLRPAVDRVIAYGTRVLVRSIETPDGPREYWRVLRLYASSYHPAAVGGNTITATGRHLEKGIVGIDPDLIPYGTQVYVAGYGVGVAADTGAERASPRWIELGYSDDDYVHWSEWVEVYLLTPVPADIDYHLPE